MEDIDTSFLPWSTLKVIISMFNEEAAQVSEGHITYCSLPDDPATLASDLLLDPVDHLFLLSASSDNN